MSGLHDFIVNTVGDWGYLAVLLLMVPESACIPIPSEVTMTVAGLLAAEGKVNLLVVALVGAFANLLGSLIAYWVGATGGRAFIVRWGRYVRLKPHDLDRAEDWFKRYGDKAVFWSRMLPVVRTFISLPAGMARMDLKRFSAYSFLGSVPWCLGLAFGGYKLGQNWDKLANNVEYVSYALVVLIVAAIAFLILRARRKKASTSV